ncbi:hypothetical protein SKAU_G00088510 [Synaphobranchus kaupii]|uniref:Uncharacterized protein n=1 Tax=Synaphobranchus kaupii TaxID=118154 RepID=A0A9Q1J693_SYNKA|nr:hypothetical protein SKAU_G00088510 [Synaphobranchus kaupii]
MVQSRGHGQGEVNLGYSWYRNTDVFHRELHCDRGQTNSISARQEAPDISGQGACFSNFSASSIKTVPASCCPHYHSGHRRELHWGLNGDPSREGDKWTQTMPGKYPPQHNRATGPPSP